jgi:RNA 2',3'-cyclic 3'-phosphodiesterase
VRLFVGLAPPAAVLDDLTAACAPFRLARDDLRWTSRELWHVTLAFLGEVSEETLGRLAPGLERAAGRHRAFTLRVAGAGSFSNPVRPATVARSRAWPRPCQPPPARPVPRRLTPTAGLDRT